MKMKINDRINENYFMKKLEINYCKNKKTDMKIFEKNLDHMLN